MTFSNPQYPIYQTAPYIDQSTGKDVRTALVGDSQPLEDQSVLELPDDYGVIGGGTTPPGPGPGITIGTVTVNGDTTVAVGDTVTYTASASGSAGDIVYTFSAPGETFTGGTVTWANDGATTVTATATSATATDSPQTGTRAVTVAAAPAPGVSFTSFTSSSISDGESLSSNSPYHFNGSPNGCTGNNRSPQLSWAVDDDSDVATYAIMVSDVTSPWVHWSASVPNTVTTMAEDFDVVGAGGTVDQNSWDTAGVPGSNVNGYGGPCPPGSQHTYRMQVVALDAGGDPLATSDPIEFTA